MLNPRTLRLILCLVCFAAVGCSSRRDALTYPPSAIYTPNVVNINASPLPPQPVERQATEAMQVSSPTPIASNGQKLNVLVLSGAGQYAAFLSGLLIEWRNRGDCPEFDVYTGISSGAIVAILGCLGPKYHDILHNLVVTMKFDELFSLKPLPYNILKHKAIARPDGAVKLVEQILSEEMVNDLAEFHRSGKRLYVGTLALNTRRLVVWDIGAIASSCQPDRVQLIRKIMLASCSITGFVPPVNIKVNVDGVEYEELHGDAGAVAQVFLRLGENMPRPDPANPNVPWLAGSNMYIIGGGKMYADILTTKIGFLDLVFGTINATLYGLYRADLWRLYTYCKVSGMKYHLTCIPEEKIIPASSMKFDPKAEREMYEMGREFILQNRPWRLTPPGNLPGEEDFPRSGTVFRTKNQ